MTRLTDKERAEISKKLIAGFGEDLQKRMAIEEMAELTKELCKSWRDKAKSSPEAIEESLQHIREEAADVLVTVGTLEQMYGKDEIEQIVDAKLRRALKRLKKYQAKKVAK
ncbi:hypothetical protein FWF48_03180 [Candidatus Saccharibacteria bacterium]|nr:hypothetical protein [Candidatus Saccharibacteria bacterium]